MECFVITEELLKDANTYIPLKAKEAIAKSIAESCVREQKDGANNITKGILPPLMFEDSGTKALLVAHAFVTNYFNAKFDAENPYDEYDYYMGGNPIGQLEAYKGVKDLRDKAYAILADYKQLVRMIDCEIYAVRSRTNNDLQRLASGLLLNATPENLEKFAKAIKDGKMFSQTMTDEIDRAEGSTDD